MRYSLSLHITYEFARPAGGGRQQLRVLPSHLPGRQKVVGAHVSVHPRPLEEHRFRDFFGTEVIEVVLPARMTELKVEMRAEVDRQGSAQMLDVSAAPAAMAGELAAMRGLGPDSPHHYLAPSPGIPMVPAISDFAAEAVAGAPSLRAAVEAFGRALHAEMVFDAKATEVDTPVAEAWAGRRGVCQDFAQIMIAGLRAQGIPAAYVAGYLRTLPPPGKKRLQGADAMHAWVRAWTGRQGGWVEYDATNACWAEGDDHIAVGFGRDYGDVAPVTGTWRLDGEQTGSHSVDIAEIDE